MERWRAIAVLDDEDQPPMANKIAYAKNYTAILDEV